MHDHLFQNIPEVALRALTIFGEDEDAAIPPLREPARGPASRHGHPGAEVVANPIDEPTRLCIGLVAELIGDALHFIEEMLLPDP